MRQLRETDEISCRRRRLSDHEESPLAADQVVAEIMIQHRKLVEDRQAWVCEGDLMIATSVRRDLKRLMAQMTD